VDSFILSYTVEIELLGMCGDSVKTEKLTQWAPTLLNQWIPKNTVPVLTDTDEHCVSDHRMLSLLAPYMPISIP